MVMDDIFRFNKRIGENFACEKTSWRLPKPRGYVLSKLNAYMCEIRI